MRAVIWMMLLVFADVSLPAEVHVVDGLDEEVGLVARLEFQVKVTSLERFLVQLRKLLI